MVPADTHYPIIRNDRTDRPVTEFGGAVGVGRNIGGMGD